VRLRRRGRHRTDRHPIRRRVIAVVIVLRRLFG